MKNQKKHIRREIGNAVQVGFPRKLHEDFYFYLMHWSWYQIFSLLIGFYLGGNFLFACLYWLQPGSVANAQPNSFLDCFFFSVQTMATIGYGLMAPATLYAHIIVTIEAALGLLGVSMCTGVMFARLSRPKAKVVFSDSFVVSTHNGLPTLYFRAANARGNDLVEANISVVMMIQETTAESHKMRRMIDIKLERSRSPAFRLSWTVMHTIDASSPLANLNWLEPDGKFLGFLVSLMGFDGTYGQNVFARKIYYPENLRYQHHFADVLTDLPDGKILFDYNRFHEVIADSKSPGAL